MTLYRQLVLMILVLFVLMFMGTLLINFHSTRGFLAEQLETHAQDTATSLGVSLTPFMKVNDIPTMKSLIDAIYDRGYYREITVATREGLPLITRTMDVPIKNVPTWFVNWVDLEAPQTKANLMSGWRQAGSVSVQSNTNDAYEQLWHTLTRTLFWFACAVLLVIWGGTMILRSLLKPLKAMELQAEAVSSFQYEVQKTLPKTRELRSVVLAMNRMTQKVKAYFEEQAKSAEHLRVLSYRDALTGIGNRRYFDIELQAHLKSNGVFHQGALLLIQLHDLSGTNNRHGYQAGDELVKQVVGVLQQATADHVECVLARLAGADFGLLITNARPLDAENMAAIICRDLGHLYAQEFSDSVDVANIGIALYTEQQQAVELLAEADMALRAAQAQGPNTWYRYTSLPQPLEVHGGQEWNTYINDMVHEGRVVLHIQPVVDIHAPNTILHQEVLVRVPGQHSTLLAARMFMPRAEQLGITLEIDRAVLTQVITHLSKNPIGSPLAVNLSLTSLRDPGFADWLFVRLAKIPDRSQKIEFEFSEFMAVRELDKLRDFVTRLRKMGHGFGLDQFGRGFSAFGYLQSLRPNYVKIDSSYTDKVIEDRDNQFLLRTLCIVAHSLDITVIAQSVESQAQWEMMKELNVDGVQGYAVGQPHPLLE